MMGVFDHAWPMDERSFQYLRMSEVDCTASMKGAVGKKADCTADPMHSVARYPRVEIHSSDSADLVDRSWT